MQIGGEPERVKLKVDLTRYNEKAKEGELGWTIPGTKLTFLGSSDTFVAVRFDNGISMDILYKSLEFINRKWNKFLRTILNL